MILMAKRYHKNNTDICFGDSTKPNVGTVLDDGVTGATEINIDVAAVMHAELMTGDHHDASINTSDMCRAIDLTTDK